MNALEPAFVDAPAFGGHVEKSAKGWGIGLHNYPVVRREDGSWLYLLPSVIDDMGLGITHVVRGCVLTPEGWVRGSIEFSARIEKVEGSRVDGPADGEDIVLPGFVDLHVHGGAGADIMDGADAIERIARLHARHGTTSLLATTVTASVDALPNANLSANVYDISPEGRVVMISRGIQLLTGTGIVPPSPFTLQQGDVITIAIDHIGTLVNTVA